MDSEEGTGHNLNAHDTDPKSDSDQTAPRSSSPGARTPSTPAPSASEAGSASILPPTTTPSGTLRIVVDLSDSARGTFVARTVEQLDTTGKHAPTIFATGRCNFDGENSRAVRGCRYWLMMADNKRGQEKETPDVISFLIYDRNGKRVAYGTGPVESGDVAVQPTSE